ncbi:hypothetical protein K474DRAFT_664092 [Panus rudis PR-1116 ss-1]|nr:hypothetical protein K474DRAFT_664092 [Panus rudis PR-1116 ss-1]
MYIAGPLCILFPPANSATNEEIAGHNKALRLLKGRWNSGPFAVWAKLVLAVVAKCGEVSRGLPCPRERVPDGPSARASHSHGPLPRRPIGSSWSMALSSSYPQFQKTLPWFLRATIFTERSGRPELDQLGATFTVAG